MIYALYFKVLLFALLFVISLLLFKAFRDQKFDKASFVQRSFLLTLLLIFIFFLRLMYMQENEKDMDSSTWLSSLLAFNHYPDKIWTLLNYTDSRPLTVLPLIMGHWLALPVSYLSGEVIGLAFWLGTIACLGYICTFFTSKSVSMMMVWSLSLFVGTIWHGFAAYNSEHVSIFMLAVSISGYFAYLYRKWDHGLISLLMGMLLGSLVYAKFQNVPMGMLTGIFLFWEMMHRKEWKNGAMLLAGSVLPTLAIHLYYMSHGSTDVFWNNYFWNNFYYSYTQQFSAMAVSERFSIFRAVHFIMYSGNAGYYFLTLGLLIPAAFMLTYKKLRTKDLRKRKTLAFGFMLLLVSFYAVLQSGNNFQHYKLYLIVPLLLVTAMLMARATRNTQTWLAGLLLVGSMAQTARNIKDTVALKFSETHAAMDRKVIETINKNSRPNDPIVIWGWRDGLYVQAKRPMGYRDAHMFHFSLKSPLIGSWTQDFIADMETNQPKIFIEAMIPEYSERGHLCLQHHEVPVIREYIQRHHTQINELNGVKIFKRI
jgi:hypothetical protein